MSKAEKLALKLIIPKQVDNIEELCRFFYIKGYKQAEKDFVLTWEDMNDIIRIYEDVLNMESCKNIYIEVLNRFNKQKGK